MMVLVDTSVWIRAFHGQEPYATEAYGLLDRYEMAGHELIYGELLIGDRGGRKNFLAFYELMYQARNVPHETVVALVRHRGLHGAGIGWIDAHLLTSALAEGFKLWTADANLAMVAKDFGIAYK